MKKLLAGIALIALIAIPVAKAQSGASTSFTLILTSPASTTVTLTPTAPCTGTSTALSCPGPLAAGTQIATIAVAPSGWTGGLTLSGTNAAAFAIGGASPNYTLTVGASALAIGANETASITATP
jgi:hypothetical protein